LGVGKRDAGRALQKVLGQGGNVNADNPLEVHDPKVGSLISYEGVTTADGAADGSTLIDNVLATLPDYDGNLVIITSGAYTGQGRDINGVTTGGTVTPHLPFGGQILIGTTFVIAAIRLTPVEVAALTALVVALMADVGDASASTLGSILAILGDPATAISTLIGTAADAGDLGTLFGRHLREFLGTHTHALVVVHDTSALDADLDTALQAWLLDEGFVVTLADPTDVAGELEAGSFDLVVVSASCVAGDVGNLANLNRVGAPVICHSAAIAASAVFELGGTPHTHAAQTEIEITDNTVMFLITQALGDLVVTASANIYAMNTITAASVELAQVDSHVDDHITFSRLSAGEENEAGYAAFYDRYFVGVGDYTNMNAVWKAAMAELTMHCVMEKRFTEEAVVQVKGVYQEDVPDTDFALAAIDTVLTNPPPSADAENSIVDIDQRNNRTYVLRSLWVNVTSFGTGAQLTLQLWVPLNGVVTSVDSVVVNALGIQNLMDIFGLPEVHADGIWITAITDVGNTGACSGTYRFAEAKK